MTGPFPVALRAAIKDRGLPLERLRARLAQRGIPISLTSLSDWQHGRSRPEHDNSLRAVRALEDILRIAPGSLMSLLADLPASQGIDEYSGPLGELLDSLPGARDWDLETISSAHTIYVDADRTPAMSHTKSLVRARRDGVDRTVVRYFGAPGCRIDNVLVCPRGNCRTGLVRRHRDGRVLVAELLFGQELRTGETWVLETEIQDHSAAGRTEYACAFRRPVGHYLMEIRFATRPAHVHGYFRTDLYAEYQRLADLNLNSHNAVHLTAANVTTGVLGITWEW